MSLRVWPGDPAPLGAVWDGEGTNFAVYSENATHVELCLFDAPDAARERVRVPLEERHADVFHAYLPDVRPGQLYGYRVHGPYDPRAGHRFNPRKLLVDPYARAIAGDVRWHDALHGYDPSHPETDLSLSALDSAPYVPKSVVVDGAFTWSDDRPPAVPWSRTVIYECHVKGMTARHPGVPPHLRGTYLGLASDAILDHLVSLGVTAVELLPVHHRVTERAVHDRGLSNYWGYSTLGFFAPDARFATSSLGAQVTELKTLVKALHRVGIEVLLDVVYNHTCEGDELGPTLSLRGVDNATYYRLREGDRRRYVDTTGCGAALDTRHPRALQLVVDSLRHFVTEYHVDGFRFDLATTLARGHDGFDPRAAFFALVQQDPVLSRVKLIAEPWDVAHGGWQLGRFPSGWAEWNGSFRDAVRRFVRGDPGQVSELASRLGGSSDIFRGDRGPHASINFVTCHDGMTLRDLVTHERKLNAANGEEGRDGAPVDWSRAWGGEGEPTPEVCALRRRVMKSLLATLAFAQGVPMLSHGDELGRTQRGNNNVYCQDNELAWLDWELDDEARELLEFTRRVFALRRANPAFRRRRFFAGDPLAGRAVKDVLWLRQDGTEMTVGDWQNPAMRFLGMLIHGDASDELDERGRKLAGATHLVLLNASEALAEVTLPPLHEPGAWTVVLRTSGRALGPVTGGRTDVAAHAVALLRHEVPGAPDD
ncbi:MAG: glycogen debranching protein GlgX [Polyangiaceae bacterium]|nr:glycogen debranching protein GlgX [Polyangiaceae bacterium]